MNKLYKWFCQQIADYYFYAGMRLGWNTKLGSNFLDKYNKWIEYKFLFGGRDG